MSDNGDDFVSKNRGFGLENNLNYYIIFHIFKKNSVYFAKHLLCRLQADRSEDLRIN